MLIPHLQHSFYRQLPRVIFFFLLVAALGVMVSSAAAQIPEDDAAAQEIIRTINNWRIEQGLWPLRENSTLDQMALDQANYVLSLPKMPEEGDIHLGQFGETPLARAALPQYNWPPYGNPLNMAIGEIAYTGYNSVAAQRFWEGSPIHKRTALNPAYREIGAAAIPQRWGHLYFVDFGSRPNVLPAMVDTTDHTLYLSNERYAWARSPWIHNVLKVRLFDSDGKPLDSGWETWQPEIPLPSNAGNSIYVEYLDDNGVMALAPVSLEGTTDLTVGTALSPEYSTPTATPTVMPTIATTTMTATSTPVNTVIAATMIPTPTPTLIGLSAVSVPTVTQSSTQAGGGAPNVLLLYDAKSFTVLNSTRGPINVSGLVFAGKNTSFVASRWSTQWLSGTLTALAGSDCLQVWSWLEKTQLNKPSLCRQRRSVLTVAPEQLFWKQGDFQVTWGGNVLTTCLASNTQCEVTLPAN